MAVAERDFHIDLDLALLIATGLLDLDTDNRDGRSEDTARSSVAIRQVDWEKAPFICSQCDEVITSEKWRLCVARSAAGRRPLVLSRVAVTEGTKILIVDKTSGERWKERLIDPTSLDKQLPLAPTKPISIGLAEKASIITIFGQRSSSLILIAIDKLAETDRLHLKKDADKAARLATGPRGVVIDCKSDDIDVRTLAKVVREGFLGGGTRRLIVILGQRLDPDVMADELLHDLRRTASKPAP